MADIQGRILVADDYIVNRMQLKRSLEQQGHTVALAENGSQALEMLGQGDFPVHRWLLALLRCAASRRREVPAEQLYHS